MSHTTLPRLEGREVARSREQPDWLEPVRRTAMDRFSAVGFPTARDEEWRFTPVGPIAHGSWRDAPAAAETSVDELAPFLFGHPEWNRLVFVDGWYRPELSCIAEIDRGTVSPLSEALRIAAAPLRAHLGRYAAIGADRTRRDLPDAAHGAAVEIDMPAHT